MADRNIFISDSPKNPKLKVSPFDLSFVNNITTKFGVVSVPYIQYCPPKTRLRINPTFAFKLAPLVFPIQTNVRAHLKFYKVPLRILWENWEDFQSMVGTNGLPTNGGGTQHVVPYIKRPTGWNGIGSLSEQIGCSNFRLTNVDSFISFKGVRRTFSRNLDLPFSSVALPSVRCMDVEFGNKFALINYLSSNTPIAFQFRLATLSSTASLNSGSITVNVCTEKMDGSLSEVLFSTSFTAVNSNENYSSSAVSCYFANSSNTNSYINGHSCYLRTINCRVVDEDFLSKVKFLVDGGQKVVFRFTFSGTILTHAFPDLSPEDVFVILNSERTYTKLNSDTGDLTSTEEVQKLISRLGIIDTIYIGCQSAGTQIDTKFDSIDNADPEQPVCALPFRALEFIHNYFMRNPRIDPFIKDGNPSYNKFLTNVSDGADSTTPIETWNALYEDDYFTTCVKEPQFGNAPLVGVTVNDLSDKGILRFADETDPANNYTVEVPLDENGAALPVTMYKEIADKPNIQRLNELIKFGISINDLRNVSTFQRMLERMQRTGHRYANVVYEFFGTNPPVGDHYPRYLGGCTRNITVDEIMNTALSENAKLGEPAGVASFAGKGKSIKCFCSEASYVIGILYFTVTPTYSQYLPKHLLYKTPLDFYLNPEFAFMGPQPVYKKEIAPNQISSEQLDDLFGYNRPYAELASRVDEVHGQFKTTMANYLLQRMFAGSPELNTSFIEIRPEHLLNIFSVTENTDKIWGQVYFKVKASLPFPRSYQPRSI